MSIVSRQLGEQVRIADDILVTLLGISRCEVKLGVCASFHARDDATANEHRARFHNRGLHYYYLFPKRGECMMVLRCATGKSVSLNGTSMLTVLSIAEGTAVLRIAPCENSSLLKSVAGTVHE